jgi:DNA adenine methylase
VDPPYWGSEHCNGRELFGWEEFALLAGHLRSLQGRFIITVNDIPELRAMFDWAQIETAGLTYSVGSQNGKPAREIIITNHR